MTTSLLRSLLATAALAVTMPLAQANTAADIEAQYRQERAACLSGQTGQERAACLREAEAARVEARRGNLRTPDAAARQANAEARCQRVAPTDREACLRMARGEGERRGSVAGGGVIREIVTVVPAASAPAR